MNGAIIHYYFLKKVIDKVPTRMKSEFELTDDLIFNYANFNSSGEFYKLFNPIRIDKYKLHNKLNSKELFKFILECIIKVKKTDEAINIPFIYGMISHYVLKKELDKYLNALMTDKTSLYKAYNMLDYFYALKEYKFDLSKKPLTKLFKDAYTYYDYQDELIHTPCIKVFKFFSSKIYFEKCMKRKKFFYKHMTLPKMRIKRIGYFFYDLIFNHKGKVKAKDYIYHSKMDTRLLNITKKEYEINYVKYNYSFEEVINNTLDETMVYINAINDYLFLNKEKGLKKAFNINDEFEL